MVRGTPGAPDGRVAFIDFGIVGTLSPDVVSAARDCGAALANGRHQAAARALIALGATGLRLGGKPVEEEALARDLKSCLEKFRDLEVVLPVCPPGVLTQCAQPVCLYPGSARVKEPPSVRER